MVGLGKASRCSGQWIASVAYPYPHGCFKTSQNIDFNLPQTIVDFVGLLLIALLDIP